MFVNEFYRISEITYCLVSCVSHRSLTNIFFKGSYTVYDSENVKNLILQVCVFAVLYLNLHFFQNIWLSDVTHKKLRKFQTMCASENGLTNVKEKVLDGPKSKRKFLALCKKI